MDSPIATELTQLVLQKRRERGEFGPSALDSTNKRLYAIPSLIAHRRTFIADTDEYVTDCANPNPVSPALGARE